MKQAILTQRDRDLSRSTLLVDGKVMVRNIP